ncbi:MAG TPA: MFS transporter [Anaeromyxobacteraceae bacterium]|nr:MFS transporter [Anaeromyxobacteraceae bacterium]
MSAGGADAPVALASRATGALAVGTVAAYAAMYVTQPLLPMLSAEFGVPPATAGLSVSAVVLAIAAGSFLAGPLSDALGRKAVMVGALALLVLPTVGCALASTFPRLVALRAAQGLLIPGVTAVAVAWAGDHYAPGRLRTAVGVVIAASVAGGLLGRVLSGVVAGQAGWRAAFLVSAAVTAAGAAGMALELPGGGSRGAPWRGAFAGMFRHLRDRRLVGGFALAFCLFFAFIAVFTYLPYRLAAPPFGLSTDAIAAAYLVYVAGIVVSPAAGRLATRVSPVALILAGLAVSAAGVAVTLAASLPLLVLGLLVLVVGMFTAQAIGPSYVNETAREAKGGANALYLAAYYLGGTLGSWLPGLAWQRWGWPGVAATSLAALGVGALAVGVLCRAPARVRAA